MLAVDPNGYLCSARVPPSLAAVYLIDHILVTLIYNYIFLFDPYVIHLFRMFDKYVKTYE